MRGSPRLSTILVVLCASLQPGACFESQFMDANTSAGAAPVVAIKCER